MDNLNLQFSQQEAELRDKITQLEHTLSMSNIEDMAEDQIRDLKIQLEEMRADYNIIRAAMSDNVMDNLGYRINAVVSSVNAKSMQYLGVGV